MFVTMSSVGRCAVVFATAVAFLVARAGVHARTQEPQATQSSPQQQPPPTQQPKPAPGGQLSRPPIRFALPRRVYTCAGGTMLTVLLETNAVRVMLDERVYDLKALPDGTKYSNGSTVWATDAKGETGTLEDDTDTAKPKALAQDCRLQSMLPLSATPPTTITGTVTFGKRPALPEDAVLVVELRNEHLLASDPATKLAEVTIPLKGHSFPVAFELKFDRSKIPGDARPALWASISSRDKRLFALKEPVAVPDLASPKPVALTLSPPSRSRSQEAPPAKNPP